MTLNRGHMFDRTIHMERRARICVRKCIWFVQLGSGFRSGQNDETSENIRVALASVNGLHSLFTSCCNTLQRQIFILFSEALCIVRHMTLGALRSYAESNFLRCGKMRVWSLKLTFAFCIW